MEKFKFEFKVRADADNNKANCIAVTLIITLDGKTYAIPENSQHINLHTELSKTAVVAKIKKTLKKKT